MTGAEGVVAGAVVRAAGKAVEDDAETKTSLLKAAEGTPTHQHAAELRARRVVVRQAVRLKMLEPLGRLAGIQKEYFNSGFLLDINEAVAHIPDERLVEPKASIAGPAITGLAQTLDEAELKAMYLSLLASASDSKTADSVHVSFAALIGQISATEAALLQTMLAERQAGMGPTYLAVVRIRLKREPSESNGISSFNVISEHHFDPALFAGTSVAAEDATMFVDNWVRLGLVTVTYGEHLVRPGAYKWAEDLPDVRDLRRYIEATGGVGTVDLQQGVLGPTSLAQRWAQAVLPHTEKSSE